MPRPAASHRTALRLAWAALWLCSGLGPGAAQAARPMIVDDARIVDPKACQLETWGRRNDDGHEVWALPACTVADNLELTVGAGRLRSDGEPSQTDVVVQAKTVLRPLTADGWGLAVMLGNVQHRPTGGGPPGDLALNLPASVAFGGDRVVLHANVGLLHARGHHGGTRLTGGLGSETVLHPRLTLVAESFKTAVGKPLWHLGLRIWLVPDRVQVDATLGDRWGGSDRRDRWVSMGLRLLTPAFLP
ncbi:hypothetical protein [Aquabacterium sp. J223]|uniref:hypothetical protein n=1 Tax=Aquabacterium sp. J223 TaxID=2898431 RepID=UPI0021AD6B6B|nr:hypothetical protein [Aquabacterium sp. J223]UUX96985.1 hypothetical protein LRS07_06905 [Aquabacterium sp. J223]